MNFKKIGIATALGFVAMALSSAVPLSAFSYAVGGAAIGWALERFEWISLIMIEHKTPLKRGFMFIDIIILYAKEAFQSISLCIIL